MPFMTFVTRCYRRPKALARCIGSVKAQSDQDYEHIFIVDDIGRGLHWANKQFFVHRNRVQGDYVRILDDDDVLTDKDFIKTIKSLKGSPDVVMFKIQIANTIYPTPPFWKKYPHLGRVSQGSYCVKNHVYRKHIWAFGAPRAGDFYFIKEVFDAKYSTVWVDKVFSYAGRGKQKPEY